MQLHHFIDSRARFAAGSTWTAYKLWPPFNSTTPFVCFQLAPDVMIISHRYPVKRPIYVSSCFPRYLGTEFSHYTYSS